MCELHPFCQCKGNTYIHNHQIHTQISLILATAEIVAAYKVPGEKEWRFIPSELVDFVKGNKRESCLPSFEDMEAMLSRGTRCRHKDK